MFYSAPCHNLQIDGDTDNVDTFIFFVFVFSIWDFCWPSILLCFKLLMYANWFGMSTIDNGHRCQDILSTNFIYVTNTKEMGHFFVSAFRYAKISNAFSLLFSKFSDNSNSNDGVARRGNEPFQCNCDKTSAWPRFELTINWWIFT